MTSSYASYQALMQKLQTFPNAIAVMSWDNEVNLPEASGPLRARQNNYVGGFVARNVYRQNHG